MDFGTRIEAELDKLERAGRRRSLTLPDVVSFTHNDYLGLSAHPEVRAAGQRALTELPSGSRGSRLLGGNSHFFETAEERIAAHFRAPAALLFSSGYLANVGTSRALSEIADVVVSDQLNHASLIDGIQLSKASKMVVPHGDWADAIAQCQGRRSLFITEALFSMDGDLVSDSYWECARLPESLLMVDEAHAAGIFAEEGRGWSASRGDFERKVVTVTFGKAFGVAGAAVLCSRRVKDWLVNRARTFIYSTAPSPVTVAMVLAALEVCEREPWRRQELWSRAERVRAVLERAEGPGALVLPAQSHWGRRSPVIALRVPRDVNALRFSENMRESGFEIRAIRYPTVAVGQERLRLSLTLAVDWQTTEALTKALVDAWKVFSLQE